MTICVPNFLDYQNFKKDLKKNFHFLFFLPFSSKSYSFSNIFKNICSFFCFHPTYTETKKSKIFSTNLPLLLCF